MCLSPNSTSKFAETVSAAERKLNLIFLLFMCTSYFSQLSFFSTRYIILFLLVTADLLIGEGEKMMMM